MFYLFKAEVTLMYLNNNSIFSIAQMKSKEKSRSRANSTVSLGPQSSAWQDKMEKEMTSLKNVVQSLEKSQKDILQFMKDNYQSDDDDEYEA